MTDASFLAEEILRNAGEWDPGEDAVEVAAVSYVRHLEARQDKLGALARDMLSRFTRTSDGHRARVGQVQIARWEKQLGASGAGAP